MSIVFLSIAQWIQISVILFEGFSGQMLSNVMLSDILPEGQIRDLVGPYVENRNLVWAFGVQVAIASLLQLIRRRREERSRQIGEKRNLRDREGDG